MKMDMNGYRVKTTLVLLTALLGLEARLHAAADPNEAQIHAKILAIGDFHGQFGAGKKVSNRPVGSAAVLASYLKAAQAGYEDRCVIVHCGDHVGASTPASGLLQDEPSIMFFNVLGNAFCSASYRLDPRSNLVGTIGNHEFDEGWVEMWRLIHGGNHANGPFLEDPYAGANFPYVLANVVDAQTGQPILLPYVIKEVAGIPIGFIGAIAKDTPTIVTPEGVAGLEFLDEAETINHYARLLQAQGVRSIIVLLHQGEYVASSYTGPTDPSKPGLSGVGLALVSSLDDEVDVVLSAHAHSFTNTIVTNARGKGILTTQAYSSGTAYADVDLTIDPVTKDIVDKSAMIVTTWADEGPGLTPDARVASLVADADFVVAPIVNRPVGTSAADLSRTQNEAGESALGNLVADAQRAAMGTDFAFMNPGGIRTDIAAGDVTWGELYAVQPFSNDCVRMELTGQQVYDLLNRQWFNQPYARVLQISGLAYTWDNSLPAQNRIVEVRKDGIPIDRTAVYTATVNSFLSGGGDNFTVLKQGMNKIVGPVDLDALVDYVRALPQPFSAAIEGRITRLN